MRTPSPGNLSTASPHDAELADSARVQLPYDTRAYEVLVARYERKVHRTCQRMLGSSSEADDAAQEIFLSVYFGLATFEGRSTFSTWLFQIARNECLSRLRKRQREEVALSQLEADALSDFHSLNTEQPKDDIETLLSMLSVVDREILTLRFVSDLALDEIAATLSLSLSATKMRLYRAIDKLKENMAS